MSTKSELVECFKINICPYCMAECNNGITFTQFGAKCMDFKKREEEHKKEEKIFVTANKNKPIMRGIV